MLIAGLVMLGGMTAGMWAMKRELSIRLDATEKQSEYFSERLQIARDYIETQHKTIEEMRDTMKRNENALSKLSRTVQHANESDAEFRKEYEKLKKRMPEVEIGLLHGRMSSKEKAQTMKKFKNGEVRILVSTPVVEVGIDVPTATIMIVEAAERFGLAREESAIAPCRAARESRTGLDHRDLARATGPAFHCQAGEHDRAEPVQLGLRGGTIDFHK